MSLLVMTSKFENFILALVLFIIIFVFGFFVLFLGSIFVGILPWWSLIIHYLICVFATMLGSYRALGNHRYLSFPFQKSHETHFQFYDSTSIVGGLLTQFWAPFNLNFHSLHHLLPSLPYHSMPAAHARLLRHPTWRPIYCETIEKSLVGSLRKLFFRASQNWNSRSKLA